MAMKWTVDQQKVIDLRDRNILVSAAAGSGKTAVLVERIISMVMDKEHPMDIDRLLIVTFTKAAANEMCERIGAALEKRLEEDPDNQHLQKQTTLLHHAQISTIHGFCSYVIRNYFHKIDLDPGYRMADEGELKLLKTDVVEDVLEQAYAEKSEDFISFVESYSTGKTDEGLAEMILRLHEFSSSAPWPDEWLNQIKENYHVETWEDMEKSSWMQYLWQEIRFDVEDALRQAKENLKLLELDHAPLMYEQMLKEDEAGLTYAAQADSYKEMSSRIRLISFSALSRKKGTDVDPDLKELVKNNRNRIKDQVKELQERYFFASPEQMLETMKSSSVPVQVLVDLTKAFAKAYQEKKREKNLLDFSDLEHMTLEILLDRSKNNTEEPENQIELGNQKVILSDVARELSGKYDEILIDEYQDSNLVQEYLLNSVSAAVRGKKNVFMVGDVKQSIYRFRQARPELFMEKLDTYTYEDSPTQKVGLHKNFRSRKEVLTSVNFFFQQIMGRTLGGVEYDKDAALYTGAIFEEGNDPEFARTEILAVETDTEEFAEDMTGINSRELEARAIGSRIREIVGKELVWDKTENCYRPARYSDCVILLRTMSGWSDTFGQTLTAMGIPAYSTSKTGYFSALEVQTLLNYLRICDNRHQEIPYTAVLMSTFAGCTAEDLAKIKCINKEEPVYVCAEQYAKKGDDEVLRDKLKQFFSLYDEICEKLTYTPIHELIWYLVEKSGYSDYVAALPGGEQRIANVRMLVEKAIDYEKTSYGGLYHFIRYIDHLQKYNVDFGEVSIVGENDNTVRIMSIHKSKGLEFPVVFVAGMSKRFNQQDLNNPILMDADYGVAGIYVDYEKRIKSKTLMGNALRRKILKDNLGEELRVLYVAMTRAKEKLILTGTVANLETALQKYAYLREYEGTKLPYSLLMDAGSYWSWILPCMIRINGRAPIDLKVISVEELVMDETKMRGLKLLKREELLNWDTEVSYDEEMRETILQRFSYEYPYEEQGEIPVKVSVSELKKRSIEDGEAFEKYAQPEIMPLIPEFLKGKEEVKLSGADRGTAYHAIMERLDLSRCNSVEEVQVQIEQAYKKHHLTESEKVSIQPVDIVTFAKSCLGQRMKAAQQNHTLKREQPFVLGVTASDVDKTWSADEMVLVQGIIDAYFYEGDGIVLLDYKTDKVGYSGAKELVKKYKVQLDYYGEALERLTGKRVKEKIIYSFTLGEEIEL